MNKANTNKKVTAEKTPPPPVVCNKFEIGRFSYTDLDTESERTTSQFLAYPRYDYPGRGLSNLVFQTPEMKITQYGFPQHHEKFYPTDDVRNFVKIAFDPEQPECIQLREMLEKIDDYTETKKDTILGKFGKLYTYQKIVRSPQVDELAEMNEKDTKEKKEKFDYVKLRLNTAYPSNEILTTVYIKSIDDNGKIIRKEVPVKTATELDEYLTWGCKVRFIVMANKMWAAKSKNTAGFRMYGTSFKIMQMEIVPRESGAGVSIRDSFKSFAFIDNEEDTDENNGKQVAEDNSPITENSEDQENKEDNEEEEEEEDDQENDDQEQDAESESESESEPEPEPEPVQVKPVKKVVTRKVATQAK